MSTVTLTSKGQTTIPADIRAYLHLKPGDRLEFIIEKDDGRVLLMPANVDIAKLKGILPKPKKALTLEQMDKVIRKRGAKRCME
ncbi:MAG: AbrB/MazE/SpoVT family DNA-binding domain-containing protein [Gammaproteobacteria bacterium]|nr:AbrB/MazE/SpoVT family DNA-binding domain-containing protein [Gammaproteobacteria bacterium]